MNVLKDMWLKSTIASLVSVTRTAGDDLLLGEVGKREASNLDGGLNDSSGSEGVARSALTLVLDWVDSTLGSPVDGSWKS
jgi:hypothetical protein